MNSKGSSKGRWKMATVALISFTLGALLTGGAAVTATTSSPYEKLNIFAKVLSYIENDYVDHVDDKRLLYGAIRGMTEVLDPYSVFMPSEVFQDLQANTAGQFGGVGMEVARRKGKLVVVSPIEGTPAARAGIRTGDVVLSIDDKPTKDMSLLDAIHAMRGPRGTKVTVEIERKGAAKGLKIVLVRDSIKVVSVESTLLRPGYGYVRIKSFQERTSRFMSRAIDRLIEESGGDMRGLILDLRNNPGGLLDEAVMVADEFLAKGLIVSTEGRGMEKVDKEFAHERHTRPPWPLVVLVNEGSASASEVVAGALQDHNRAVIMGTKSFGKASVQTLIELEDGSGLKLTIAHYFTPKHRSIHETGIVPDAVVEPVGDQEPGASTAAVDLLKDVQVKAALDRLAARPIEAPAAVQ